MPQEPTLQLGLGCGEEADRWDPGSTTPAQGDRHTCRRVVLSDRAQLLPIQSTASSVPLITGPAMAQGSSLTLLPGSEPLFMVYHLLGAPDLYPPETSHLHCLTAVPWQRGGLSSPNSRHLFIIRYHVIQSFESDCGGLWRGAGGSSGCWV